MLGRSLLPRAVRLLSSRRALSCASSAAKPPGTAHRRRAVMVCGVKQHTGKTSVCMVRCATRLRAHCAQLARACASHTPFAPRAPASTTHTHCACPSLSPPPPPLLSPPPPSLCAQALFSNLRKQLSPASVGYMKPVGQEWVEVHSEGAGEGSVLRVDKDAALAYQFFGLKDPLQSVSPVVIGRGDTKAFLDGDMPSLSDDAMRARLLGARLRLRPRLRLRLRLRPRLRLRLRLRVHACTPSESRLRS